MLKIMVVDDSAIIRRILVKEFTKMGHTVIAEAQSGREAIKLYKKLSPDLVTMDVTMPGINGVETLKELRLHDLNAKVIMITSHGEEKLIMSAIRSGAKAYVLKPLTIDRLTEALSRVFPENY